MKKWHLESIVSNIGNPRDRLVVPDWRAMKQQDRKKPLSFRREPRYLKSLRSCVGFFQRHF